MNPATKESAPAALAISGESVASLVEQHADFVWRSLRRMGVPSSQADDATQEVFIVTSRRLQRVERGRERAFLYGVAINVAAHARRSRARSREVPGEEETLSARDHAPNPETRLAEAQTRALLDRVLDALSEELRAVFVLFELEEMTRIDIARLLDVPSGTVASRLRRAREGFRTAASRVRAEAVRTGGRP